MFSNVLTAKSSVIGDKIDINCITLNLIEYFFREGGLFAPFFHVDRGGGVCRMSTLVHSRGEGGQIWVKFGPRVE